MTRQEEYQIKKAEKSRLMSEASAGRGTEKVAEMGRLCQTRDCLCWG